MNRAQRRASGIVQPPVHKIADHLGIRCAGVSGQECSKGLSIPFRELATLKSADAYIEEAGWTSIQVEESEDQKLHVLLCDECAEALFMGDEDEDEDANNEEDEHAPAVEEE